LRNTPLTHQTSLLVTSSSNLPWGVISRVTFWNSGRNSKRYGGCIKQLGRRLLEVLRQMETMPKFMYCCGRRPVWRGRLSNAENRIRSKVRPCGIYSIECGTGAGFLQALWFLLPISTSQTVPYPLDTDSVNK
jgi:hypothetical protein